MTRNPTAHGRNTSERGGLLVPSLARTHTHTWSCARKHRHSRRVAIIFSKSVILYWCTISGNNMIIYSLHMCIKFSLFHSICDARACIKQSTFHSGLRWPHNSPSRAHATDPVQCTGIHGNASIYLFVHAIFSGVHCCCWCLLSYIWSINSFLSPARSCPLALFLWLCVCECLYLCTENSMHTIVCVAIIRDNRFIVAIEAFFPVCSPHISHNEHA